MMATYKSSQNTPQMSIFNRKPPSDEDLLRMMRAGGREENEATRFLLRKHWRGVWGFVRSWGGAKEDAEDLMAESLMALLIQVRSKRFRGEGAIQGFFVKVYRNKWLKKMRRRKGMDSLEGAEGKMADGKYEEIYAMMDRREESRLQEVLAMLRKKCKEVLVAKYVWGWTGAEIALQMDFKNAEVVSTKTNKCKKELKLLVQREPAVRKIINDLRCNPK